mmetsp:Transcript_10748/g.12765  ORF Transcript_10748/g.12765 Transcript_10748/m.12765 type:complete len:165 (+) Transcript_10748:250-744(+)
MNIVRKLRLCYQREHDFYLRYHQHPVNWMLHAFAVPLEWCSFLAALCLLHNSIPLFVAGLAGAYYVLLLPNILGLFAGLSQISMGFITTYAMSTTFKNHRALATGCILCLYCLSWIVQVGFGHWLIEKNEPGMMNKLTVNSVILSPLLAWHHPSIHNVHISPSS